MNMSFNSLLLNIILQRLNGGRKSCMLKKKCLFLIMIFSICICISSCDASYLENAEKKITILLEKNGDFEEKPFDTNNE